MRHSFDFDIFSMKIDKSFYSGTVAMIVLAMRTRSHKELNNAGKTFCGVCTPLGIKVKVEGYLIYIILTSMIHYFSLINNTFHQCGELVVLNYPSVN
jgi:hypothetical protein